MPGSRHPLLVSTAIAASALLAACGQPEREAAAAQPPPQVSVAQVLVRPINDWAEYQGRLEPPESVDIRPRVSALIESVHFRDGSRVTKGQLLFQLDPRPYQAEVDRLQAQLQHAQAQQERAHSEAARGQRLRASDAISPELAQARQTALLQASAQVAAVRSQLEMARLNLGYTRIVAPMDGHIGRAEQTAGNLVTAGASRLASLVRTDSLHAYFDIDEEAYLNRIQPLARPKAGSATAAQPARLMLVNQAHAALNGQLDFLDNQINPRTGTLRARVTVDNRSGELAPGLWARIQLPASAGYDAALVRDEAIGTDQGQRYVLVLDGEGVVRYRQVRTGPRFAGLRVVREGLHEGEQIVVNGLQRARPGTRVAPQPVAMADEQALERMAQWPVQDTPASTAQGTAASSDARPVPRG